MLTFWGIKGGKINFIFYVFIADVMNFYNKTLIT